MAELQSFFDTLTGFFAGPGDGLSLWQFLIICPLVFTAGFVDAVAGGGGLISLPAYLIAGVAPHLALGTNKLAMMMGTAVATLRYIRAGFVNFALSCLCVPCALFGSACGARLALAVGDRPLKIALLFLLPATAFMLMRTNLFAAHAPRRSQKTAAALAMAAALVIGVYDGFYGPGTGTFLILILTLVCGMGIREANGMTKVINLSTNVAAMAVFLAHGQILVPLALCGGACAIAGNYLGAGFFKGGHVRGVRAVMLAVIAVFFVKVSWELITGA